MDQQHKEPSAANKPNPNQDPSPNSDPELDRANGQGTANTNTKEIDKLRIDGGVNLNDNHGSTTQSPLNRSKKSVRWSEELVTESPSCAATTDFDAGLNPYMCPSPMPPSYADTLKDSVSTVKDVLGRWGKKVGEATRKAEDLSKNTWQHLKTAPSLTDAALGRIAQGAKFLADGGYEKIFRQTFETVPEERLQDSFACYLSTSAGPVMGVMYLSTAKLAFCSDNPISYKSGDKTEWSFYKVVIPLHQLQAVNPSTSRTNSAEKYIQVISVDSHEFWYMGFLNYDAAVRCLQEALLTRDSSV